MPPLGIEYYPLNKELAEASSLSLPKAVELVNLLLKEALPYAHLVSCYRDADSEIVVIDIEPEVPQHPVFDVRAVERIAIVFKAADEAHQEVLALRKDFPIVPHMNFGSGNTPRSLCLYLIKYADLKPSWTAAALLQQLHHWLNQTARGELHERDQPLEQVFYAPPENIILPSKLFENGNLELAERLTFRTLGTTLGKSTFVAFPVEQTAIGTQNENLNLLTFIYTTPPLVHGLIREQPRTLAGLIDYLGASGNDFIEKLRNQVVAWYDLKRSDVQSRLLILLRIPKRRQENDAVEAVEVWSFASIKLLLEIGIDLGIWVFQGLELARLIPIDITKRGNSIELYLLNPIRALTRESAAAFNGLAISTKNCIAIGVGSLGSQVVNNLMRAGQGFWTLVDEDQYLPHNVARHYLPGLVVGFGKAKTMGSVLEGLFENNKVKVIEADVLKAPSNELLEAYSQADLILDMSASIAVARELTLSTNSPARRVSLFLNPSGSDLVLLAEAPDRKLRLDQLEMEYYRALMQLPELSNHLVQEGEPIRYSHACRDISVQIPQDQVALHAAISSRAVQYILHSQTDPCIKIWQASSDLTVSMQEIHPESYVEMQAGLWTLNIAESVINNIASQRTARLPNETGGVLVGTFDTQRRHLYIIDLIPSPPDSQEWPTAYYRGVEGLLDELLRIERLTGKQVVYVGEWHSHPKGAAITPSNDDRKLFAWLQNFRLRDGLPAVIAIAGDHSSIGWYVDNLDADFAVFTPNS